MTVEELNLLMENTWGEEEECVESLMRFFNNDTSLIASILNNDRSFNRYSCVYSWSDLANEILYDEMFQTEEYINDETMTFIRKNEDNEKVLKEFLIKQNWAIDRSTGYAIGFDSDIEIAYNEI